MFAASCSLAWGSGETQPRPQARVLWGMGCSPCFGECRGSVSWVCHLLLRVWLFSLPQQCGLHQVGPCSGTGSLGSPKCSPGQEHLLWTPNSPCSISATPSCGPTILSHPISPADLNPA